jgi:DNA-binding NarL/FixJ family response regulator
MRVLLTGDCMRGYSMLKWLLAHDPELCVVGEVTEAEDLLAQVEQTRPNLVLLNWEMPGLRVADLLVALRAICSPLKVVACSECEEVRREALSAGVSAFINKEEPPNCLVNTLHLVGGLSPCFVE